MSETGYQRVTFPTITPTETTAPSGSDRFRAATRAEVRGHAAGYAAGLRQAGAEVQALAERLAAEHAARVAEHDGLVNARLVALDAAIAALHARVAPVLTDAADTMAAAAFDLAETLVGHALDAAPVADPGTSTGREARLAPGARAAVARALASVDPSTVVVLRLAPEDVAALADTDLPVPVTADAGLRHGDAVAELTDGLVDARIGTALERARQALGGTA